MAIELASLAEVGGTLGKALGTLFKDTGKTVLDRVKTRYAEHLPVPPNHDLQIALRLSGLGAAQIILANERRLIETDGARAAPELRFITAAEAWLSQAIPLLPTHPLAPNEPLVATLETALDHILPGGDVTQLRAAMRTSESLAWAELTANAAGHGPSDTLVTAFHGNAADEPGWSLLFLALVREALKSTPKANIAYITSRLAKLRTLFDDLEQRAEAYQEELRRRLDHQDSQLATILAHVQHITGVPLATLQRILTAFGEHAASQNPAEIESLLFAKAIEFQALRERLARLTNDDPRVSTLRREAAAHIDNGNFTAADTALATAEDIDVRAIEEAETLARARRRSAGETRASRAATARLRLDYRAAAEHYRQAATLDPDNPWHWFELGDILSTTSTLNSALAAYQSGQQVCLRRAQDDPHNALWQRDLSVSHNKIGDVQSAQGNLAAALASFQASLKIRERLAQDDPHNAGWQRDLSVSHNKIGDVQSAQGNLAAALASFQASLAIAQRLAQDDPHNAGWQRDLSVSHNKIGDVQSAQGNLAAALASFQASHDIFVRLAQDDPHNALWQRDLSVSHDRIGDVQSAQGNLAAALASFQASLAIAQRLAQDDPHNALWQRDLAVSHVKIGLAHEGQGNQAASQSAYRQALSIIEPLAARDPTNAAWRNDLAWIRGKLT